MVRVHVGPAVTIRHWTPVKSNDHSVGLSAFKTRDDICAGAEEGEHDVVLQIFGAPGMHDTLTALGPKAVKVE